MVYSSWATMQSNGEADADTCQYNDLAIVKLNPADYAKVNPSIPFWGGPTGVTDTVAQGDTVLSYGNSSLRLGITQLSPKQGLSLGQDSGGWNHTVYTASPGIPGDSGSAFIDAQGRAFGVLSTLQVAPLPGWQRRRRRLARDRVHEVARRPGSHARHGHRALPRAASVVPASASGRRSDPDGGHPWPP